MTVKDQFNYQGFYQDMEALCTAAAKGDNDFILKFLDEHGTVINLGGPDSETALMRASCSGHAETVRLLLAKGADPNITDNAGWTALHWGYVSGEQIITQLLDAGININKQDKRGRTALMFAALNGDTDVAALLLKRNADIHLQDENKNSALSFSLRECHSQITALIHQRLEQEEAQKHAQGQEAISQTVMGGLTKSIPAPKPFQLKPKP